MYINDWLLYWYTNYLVISIKIQTFMKIHKNWMASIKTNVKIITF